MARNQTDFRIVPQPGNSIVTLQEWITTQSAEDQEYIAAHQSAQNAIHEEQIASGKIEDTGKWSTIINDFNVENDALIKKADEKWFSIWSRWLTETNQSWQRRTYDPDEDAPFSADEGWITDFPIS